MTKDLVLKSEFDAVQRRLDVIMTTARVAAQYARDCEALDLTNPIFNPHSNHMLRGRRFELLAWSIDPKTGERTEPSVWNHFGLDCDAQSHRIGRKQTTARLAQPEASKLPKTIFVVEDGVRREVEVARTVQGPKTVRSSAASWSDAGLFHMDASSRKEAAERRAKEREAARERRKQEKSQTRTNAPAPSNDVAQLRSAVANLRAQLEALTKAK